MPMKEENDSWIKDESLSPVYSAPTDKKGRYSGTVEIPSDITEVLRGNVNYFLDRNKFFNDKFKGYNIKTYDTSFDRKKVLKKVIDSLE